MHELKNLPLKRWDVPYLRGESGHSYCARLVSRQGDEASLRQFAMHNGLEWRKLVPEELLAVTLKLPLSEETKTSLLRYTPIRKGTKRYLGDERFAMGEFTFKRRRWCPACIAEAPYGRVWFDLLCIQTCPYHNTPLVNRDTSGSPAPWSWPDYAVSRNNVPLGGPRMPNELRRGGLGHYVLGRLGLEEALSAPLIDGERMSDIIAACEALGSIIKYPNDENAPSWEPDYAETGFPKLAGSLADLAEFFRQYIRTHHPNGLPTLKTERAFIKLQGRLKSTCSFRPKIMRALKEGLEAQGRPEDEAIKDADVEDDRVSFQWCEDQFGIEKNAVRRIAESQGSLSPGSMRLNRLLLQDAHRAVAYARTLISVRAAAAKLYVSKSAIQDLVAEGYLVKRTQVFSHRTGPLFDPVQVDVLKKTVDDLPVTGDLATSCSFHSAVRRKIALPGELAVRVLKGEIAVAGRRPGEQGFQALLLDLNVKHKRPMLQAAKGVLTKAEAAAVLNVRSNTFECMINAGLISPKRKASRLYVFDHDEVAALADRYVRSSDFYSIMNMTRYGFRDLMVVKGVRPLPKTSVSSDTMYVRSDVLAALDLTVDPTIVTDPSLIEFWELLTTAFRSRLPKVRFPARIHHGITKAITSSRACKFSLTHDLEKGLVQVTCGQISRAERITVSLGRPETWGAMIEKVINAGESSEAEYSAQLTARNAEAYRIEKSGIV
ncbi:MAG: TniQ family protein [Rhizobium sp.]|nr:TniQ family protein [Rhizobium sp.]